MKFRDRVGWFRHNLLRLFPVIFWMPFEFLIGIWEVFKVMAVTDGSEVLCFPWEHREKE